MGLELYGRLRLRVFALGLGLGLYGVRLRSGLGLGRQGHQVFSSLGGLGRGEGGVTSFFLELLLAAMLETGATRIIWNPPYYYVKLLGGGGGEGRPGIGGGFDVTSLLVAGTFDHSLSFFDQQ